jgi:hypothetical protein
MEKEKEKEEEKNEFYLKVGDTYLHRGEDFICNLVDNEYDATIFRFKRTNLYQNDRRYPVYFGAGLDATKKHIKANMCNLLCLRKNSFSVSTFNIHSVNPADAKEEDHVLVVEFLPTGKPLLK